MLRQALSLNMQSLATAILTIYTLLMSSLGSSYPSCSPAASYVSTVVPLEQSTLTSNILCVDKKQSFPLRYNIQGCGDRYTQPSAGSEQNTTGICLTGDSPDVRLVLTVNDLQPGIKQLTCYQNSNFTSMTVIVVDRHNPYKDIIIMVNGVERNDTNDLIEGDQVTIVARVVGFMNLVQTSLCADDNVTCTPGFLCTIGRYFEYFFSSVTLAHNGTVVSFVTNNGSVLESVTLNVRQSMHSSSTSMMVSSSSEVPVMTSSSSFPTAATSVMTSPSSVPTVVTPVMTSISSVLTTMTHVITSPSFFSMTVTPITTLIPSVPTTASLTVTSSSLFSMSTTEATTSLMPSVTSSVVTSLHLPTVSPTGDSTSTVNPNVLVPLVVVVFVAIASAIVISCVCWFLKKQRRQNSKRPDQYGVEDGMQRKHGVMVHPCSRCEHISAVKGILQTKDNVVVKDLLNEHSSDDIIENLHKGEELVMCSCELGADDCLRQVLDRRKSSPEECKSWKKFFCLTDEAESHCTDELFNRILCNYDYEEAVNSIMYALNGSSSSRASTISSTIAAQQQQILRDIKELKENVTQGNETQQVIAKDLLQLQDSIMY